MPDRSSVRAMTRELCTHPLPCETCAVAARLVLANRVGVARLLVRLAAKVTPSPAADPTEKGGYPAGCVDDPDRIPPPSPGPAPGTPIAS